MTFICQAAILSLNKTKNLFPDGAAVAQLTVNQLVGGSNPSQGAKVNALIAQLVERHTCNVDVRSSSLLGGTR